MQRRFESLPVQSPSGQGLHICVGVFTVDGAPAGFYGRASHVPRIDSRASDIPILVKRDD
jgi:hypothetical protein